MPCARARADRQGPCLRHDRTDLLPDNAVTDPAQANIVTPTMAAARRYPAAIFQYLALLVLDKETGKLLEYRQLRKDPRYVPIWNPSYANELGQLCQGVGKGTNGPKKQQVAGTDTFRVMHYHDNPKHKLKDVCHTMVVCKYRPQKKNPIAPV